MRGAGCKAQNDPVLAAGAGSRLFAAWTNDFHVSFARSDDYGPNWTAYRLLDRGLAWSDKPWIAAWAARTGCTSGPPPTAAAPGGRPVRLRPVRERRP